MVRVKRYIAGKSTRLIGPNCPGLITPDVCKLGITGIFLAVIVDEAVRSIINLIHYLKICRKFEA